MTTIKLNDNQKYWLEQQIEVEIKWAEESDQPKHKEIMLDLKKQLNA